jgi:hypothetical protein
MMQVIMAALQAAGIQGPAVPGRWPGLRNNAPLARSLVPCCLERGAMDF